MNSRNYVEIERALARIPRLIIEPLCAIEVMRIFFFFCGNIFRMLKNIEIIQGYKIIARPVVELCFQLFN